MPTACHYLGLGATLYVPATRPDLTDILIREKLPWLRSVIICTEDAIHDHELTIALDNIAHALQHCSKPGPAVFVRVRNAQVLKRVLSMLGVNRIDGIVWPKATPDNIPFLAEIVADQPRLWVMPTLETVDAFDRRRLEAIREALTQLINPVLCLRIGGNDLLSLLCLKRPKAMTIYDTPLGTVIDDIVLTFAPAGYEIAAPVFDHLDSMETLARETALDVAHGLLSKTAIHPAQVPVIEAVYRVMPEDQELAKRILDPAASAVFQYAKQMCEPATHRRWAERLLLRTEIFGLLS